MILRSSEESVPEQADREDVRRSHAAVLGAAELRSAQPASGATSQS